MTPNQIMALLGLSLTLVWGLALLLLKDKASRVLQAVDRIPSSEWFENINKSMERIPPRDWFESVNTNIGRIPTEEFLDRLIKHLDRVNEMGERLRLLEASDRATWTKLEKDHDRLHKAESEIGLLTQRIALMERMK